MIELHYQFWFLFPLAILIAILAMGTGVSGANFWAPVYLLWLRFDPQLGFWLSLVTMLFGFSSGLAHNLRHGTINFFYSKPILKQSCLRPCSARSPRDSSNRAGFF